MTVVHVDGRRSKTGGRVVKNVTGYDLAKLYTGSLGSLAVIAEISFKLRPRFEKTATAIAEFDDAGGCRRAALDAIRKSALQPIACELVGPKHAAVASIRRASSGGGDADGAAASGVLESV